MRVVVKKKNNALHPVDDRSLKFISRIPEGKDVLVEINSRPRNLRHLRLYWAIVRFLQEHVFEHKDKEIIHLAIKQVFPPLSYLSHCFPFGRSLTRLGRSLKCLCLTMQLKMTC